MYEFAWKSPLFGGRLGACHALEIPFVFDTLDAEADGESLLGPAPPAGLAAAMHQAWIHFARTGDPGWQAYEPATRATMIFDQACAVAYDPRPQQRMTWEAIR